MYRVLLFQIIAAVAGGLLAHTKGRNPVIWSLLCFFFPLLFIVILVLPAQAARERTKQCPYCSGIIKATDTVCTYCNKELPINLVECTECSSFVPEGDYCMRCNKKLK